MKIKTFLIIILLGFAPLIIFSQSKAEINKMKKQGYFGLGFGMGIFNPADVNDYLSSYWDNQLAGYTAVNTYGFPEMYLNLFVQVAGGTYLSENFELKGLFELGLGPKVISIHDTRVFTYTRYSPGVMGNFHFNSEGPHNFTLGAGVLYHNMKFEEWKASALGPRIKLGYTIFNKKSILELYLAYDIVKGDTGGPYVETLSYSGAAFGVNLKL